MRLRYSVLLLLPFASLPATAAKLKMTDAGIASILEAGHIQYDGERSVLTAEDGVSLIRLSQVLAADALTVEYIEGDRVKKAISTGGERRALMISDARDLETATLYCADRIEYFPLEGRAVLTGDAEIFTASNYYEADQFEYFELTKTVTGGSEGGRVHLSNSPPPFSSFCDEQANQFLTMEFQETPIKQTPAVSEVTTPTASRSVVEENGLKMSDLMMFTPWGRIIKILSRW